MDIKDRIKQYTVHCDSEELAIRVCKVVYDAGLKWCNGRPYLENNWNTYRKETTYEFKSGSYANLEYFKGNNRTITPAVDFLKEFEKVEEFKKDSYIVLTKGYGCEYSYKANHCYKQRENVDYLVTYLDSNNSNYNGWMRYSFTDTNWRYATKAESDKYEESGKPFDIAILEDESEFTLPEKWCIKITDENKDTIHKWKLANTEYCAETFPGDYVTHYGGWTAIIADYHEISFNQFKKYVLKKDVEINPFDEHQEEICNHCEEHILDGHGGAVYEDNTWAEIISKPDTKVSRSKFKADDWVVGWHTDNPEFKNKAWQIGGVTKDDYAYPKEHMTWNCQLRHLRKATEAEIKLAKGEPKTPKYAVGDTVVLTKTKPLTWNSSGKMDKYLGLTVVIKSIDANRFTFEGDSDWVFQLNDIDHKVNGTVVNKQPESVSWKNFPIGQDMLMESQAGLFLAGRIITRGSDAITEEIPDNKLPLELSEDYDPEILDITIKTTNNKPDISLESNDLEIFEI